MNQEKILKGLAHPAGTILITLALIGVVAVLVHTMGMRKAVRWAGTFDVQPCVPGNFVSPPKAPAIAAAANDKVSQVTLSQAPNPAVNPSADSIFVLPAQIRPRLVAQLEEVCARSAYHLAVMGDFYVN